MAASVQTIQGVASILLEELGRDTSIKILNRLRAEVKGNASYTATIAALCKQVKQ